MIAPTAMRAARTKQGLTQIQVAVRVGVSYPAYRLWEMGGTRPSPDNEAKVREVLQIEEVAKDASSHDTRSE